MKADATDPIEFERGQDPNNDPVYDEAIDDGWQLGEFDNAELETILAEEDGYLSVDESDDEYAYLALDDPEDDRPEWEREFSDDEDVPAPPPSVVNELAPPRDCRFFDLGCLDAAADSYPACLWCIRLIVKRGDHYSEADHARVIRRRNDQRGRKQKAPGCSQPNCPKRAHAGGLCPACDQQLRRTGRPRTRDLIVKAYRRFREKAA